ncbi:MAG: hypothetical protein H0U74_13745 [Bradymonadaceae bacterium]|nr:hypothetical protein [Lujinxingiaceae bacterium]
MEDVRPKSASRPRIYDMKSEPKRLPGDDAQGRARPANLVVIAVLVFVLIAIAAILMR